MEREIIRLESLRRAALDASAPTDRQRLIAATLLNCLRELHAAAASLAQDSIARILATGATTTPRQAAFP